MRAHSHRPQVLAFYRDRIEATGNAPSGPEAAQEIGISNVAVWKHVQGLLHEGKLVRRKDGSIDLPGRFDLSAVPSAQLRAELARRGVTMDALEQPRLMMDEGRPCAANGCFTRVRRGHLMCWEHWTALPQRLRDDILRAFRARDTEAYQEAVEAARDHLGGFTRIAERVE